MKELTAASRPTGDAGAATACEGHTEEQEEEDEGTEAEWLYSEEQQQEVNNPSCPG